MSVRPGQSGGIPLAYQDETFLNGEDGRPLRILSEYLEPLHRLRQAGVHDTIVFFGSARLSPDGPLGRYYHEARESYSRAASARSMSSPRSSP